MLLLHYFLKYFLDAIKKLWKATIRFVTCLFIHQSSRNNLNPTGQTVMKFYYLSIFQNSVTKIHVSFIAHNNNRYFIHEDQYTFLIIHNLFLEWEMFLTKVVEKIKTHILCSITVFQKSCNLWDNWKNIVEPGRPQMTIWCMHDQ